MHASVSHWCYNEKGGVLALTQMTGGMLLISHYTPQAACCAKTEGLSRHACELFFVLGGINLLTHIYTAATCSGTSVSQSSHRKM